MYFIALTLALLGFLCVHISAFPEKFAANFGNAATSSPKNGQKMSKRQIFFDPAAQEVSTTGAHAWEAPNFAKGDQRGPCPGLNALANHAYLPRNGVSDIPTMVEAVNTAFGMSIEFGTFLAVYGTLFDGNAVSLDPGFSIGGVAPSLESGLSGLLGTPPGLSNSHNNYEADTSPTRGDYYVVNGNDQLQIPFFQEYYDALLEDTPAPEQYAALFKFRQARFNYSIATNPYFFHPIFAGAAVSPAGFAFPARMMANHSAEYPEGYLDGNTFKSFFAVTGNSGSFNYQRGWERIPNNWYRRPLGNPYSIVNFVADIIEFGLQDPRLLLPGGNVGETNTYVGLSPQTISEGVYNANTVTQGNNFQCFIFQVVQTVTPTLLRGVYANVAQVIQPLLTSINANLEGLNCPQLEKVDTSGYSQFPGYLKANGVKI